MSELPFGLDPETLKSDLERAIRSILSEQDEAAGAPDNKATGARSSGVQRSFQALHASAARVGQQPPQPPTIRARMGAAAVRMMRRALFWYIPQISQFHSAVIETFEAQGREIEALRGELRAIDRRGADAERQIDSLQPRFAATEARFAGLEQELLTLRNEVPEDLYQRFEDAFRGSREEIRSRLEVYIPFVQTQNLGTPEMPILDLGCGRGEWLDVLRSRKLCARGVDASAAMVAQCREAGLDVVEANLLDFLKELPDASIGMVTMFHVVEHLPVPILIEALGHSMRALKPGGAVIFETPNPENLRVGAHTFYTDLTHGKPIPSQTLRFLAEALGLIQLEIWNLHPELESALTPETCELERRFNQLVYGPRDYAVIGRKPAPDAPFLLR